MFENTSKGLKPDQVKDYDPASDPENQDPSVRFVVHVVLLGVVAVLVGAVSTELAKPSPQSWVEMGGAFSALLWFSFAAYAVISSLGVIAYKGVAAVFGWHVGALMVALPAGGFLMFLTAQLLGSFK
jgi:hypothetical protein